MSGIFRQARAAYIGGQLAYRALFNWTHPFMYATTLFGGPLFQMLFFMLLGRYTGLADTDFYVVGNAVLAVSGACLFGSTMAIANERRYRTLGPVLASPANRSVTFAARGWPYVAHGILAAVVLLAYGATFLGFRMDLARVPALILVMALAAASCSAFGLVLGALGVRFRDVFIMSNIAHYVLLMVSGAQIPRDVLPGWLQAVGGMLPLTAGIEASRLLAAGERWSAVWPLLLRESVVLVAYGVLAVGLMAFFEAEARRSGTLDAI